MNVLILGSGGREHALAWKIAQSSLLRKLYVAPGNPGTEELGTNLPLAVNDFKGIKSACIENEINVVLVGPEQPLVDGIADFFAEDEELRHILVVGPKKAGANLEGSKAFAKDFMKRHSIPTAAYKAFTKQQISDAKSFLETLSPPYVLKADGLAAGKGVLILSSLNEAKEKLESMFAGQFGDAGETVVIEEYMDGVEMSVFLLTDGHAFKLLPSAKDYKRVGEGDTGPNTGGMGAISPVPFAKTDLMSKINDRILVPTIHGLQNEEIPYIGFIFIGLMIVKGDPYVIEYNVRMGDPETEVVMPRMKSDLLDMFEGIATGTLSERHVEVDDRTAATVMLVSGGYPGAYEKGHSISLPEKWNEHIVPFHAGTSRNEYGHLVTNGGRVMAVTALGKDLEKALKRAYETADLINFKEKNYRKDLGQDLVAKSTRAAKK